LNVHGDGTTTLEFCTVSVEITKTSNAAIFINNSKIAKISDTNTDTLKGAIILDKVNGVDIVGTGAIIDIPFSPYRISDTTMDRALSNISNNDSNVVSSWSQGTGFFGQTLADIQAKVRAAGYVSYATDVSTLGGETGRVTVDNGVSVKQVAYVEDLGAAHAPTHAVDGSDPIPKEDYEVIEQAKSTNSTLSYTGSSLTGVSYLNSTLVTSNAKVLAYTGDQLDTVTHTFTYLTQVWTVTTTLIYSGIMLTNKNITINKV